MAYAHCSFYKRFKGEEIIYTFEIYMYDNLCYVS